MWGYFALIVVSIVTAPSLILAHKIILTDCDFECPLSLISYRCLVSALVLLFITKFKPFPGDQAVPALRKWITAFFGASYLFVSLMSLKMNSVTFYQLSEFWTLPCLLLAKFVFQHECVSAVHLCALAIALAGFCIWCSADEEFNFHGCIVAGISVLLASIFQYRASSIQEDYRILGLQFKDIVAFPQFLICFVPACVKDTHGPNSMLIHRFKGFEIGVWVFIGLFVSYDHILEYVSVGHVEPVIWKIVEIFRAVFLVIIGRLMFPGNQFDVQGSPTIKAIGIIAQLFGFLMYTFFEFKLGDQLQKVVQAFSGRRPPAAPESNQFGGNVFEVEHDC
jgi:drug/metabolite transporter (DMT)-like permease